ncbi:MAG: extracellular solute-binding protein, partial [Lachnospiraceae bacterium]|nr:extracellular solute-binding protein [Lachnospiraceae bacterium]
KNLDIPANSSAFTKIDDTLYFYVDDIGICVVDDELESFEILVDLSMEKKIWKEVFSILKHDGKYGILYQSLSDQAYRTVIFDNQKMHGKNKTEITIYDPSGYIESHCSEEIIASFNETNPDYYVSIMESERELNYVLVSKKQPDLIILSDKTANLLGMEGYLEDLTSYLNEDNTGFRDELIDGLTEKISFDKKIFALPRCIELQTFCIRSSEVDNMPGWTTDDFFDWLIADPESLKDSWIGRLQLLRFCLEGTLEHYVDFDKNECHFNGEDFYRHMRKLKEVIVYPPKDIMPADAGKIRCISLGGFMNMLMKKDYNDPWIYKGFPTYDGKEKQIMNYNALSILQASKNKEGAFEFIKYFVRYRYGDTNFFRTDIPVFQRVIQIAQREHRQIGENSSNYEAVGQEEIDMFWKLYNASEVNDISHLDIMDMVIEEAVQYTTDKKELEEVADIIQKRVQLLLNERK